MAGRPLSRAHRAATRAVTDQENRCQGIDGKKQCPNDALPGRALCEECFDREKDARRDQSKTTRRTGTPAHLLDAVNRFLNDPDRASHLENAAILDALIKEQQSGLTAPEDLIARAIKAWNTFQAGGTEAPSAEKRLGDTLLQMQTEAMQRRGLIQLMSEQRKHIEAENRREAQAALGVPAKQFFLFIDFMIALDRDTIPDQQTRDNRLAAISARFQLDVGEMPELPVRQESEGVIEAEFTEENPELEPEYVLED